MKTATTTAILLITLWGLPAAGTLPAGFTDTLVASVAAPTALAFTPDGRLLVTTSQGGDLRIVQAGSLLPTPALTIPPGSLCTTGESGLLGVAVHPSFAANHFIYLFYTFKRPDTTCVNRVSRFTLPDSNVIDPLTELQILDNMPSPSGFHNGGDLRFGKDGLLYVTIGDGAAGNAARDEHKLAGKVLRVTDSGGIPAGNPFQGSGTALCGATGGTTPGTKCQETFAWGLRNPFRIGFDPNAAGTRFFINDVGQGAWEEIDLGQAGVDYGWNCREGKHVNSTAGPCSPTPPGMVDPIFEYQHGATIPGTTSPTSCTCVSGAAFVPDGLWPGFDGAYLFGDCVCGGIFRLDESGGAFTASDFASGLGSGFGTVVHMVFGPHGSTRALYYTTYAGGGQVRRISGPAGPLGPARFHTVTPCRLVDTRQPAGPFGGPPLASGTQRTFLVSGSCGVPAGAVAVAVNLTVTSPTGAGSLTVFPAGTTLPPTSSLNFAIGQTRANNALLQLGSGGLTVSCAIPGGTTAHLLVDVVGYFQ